MFGGIICSAHTPSPYYLLVHASLPSALRYSLRGGALQNIKFQYSMTKTSLEFGILVIVICLLFVICDLESLFLHYSKQLAISAGKAKSLPFV
jgi:hypothetical protein